MRSVAWYPCSYLAQYITPKILCIPKSTALQGDEDAFKKEAKRSLTVQLLAHPAAANHPGYKAHAEAFRRCA